MASAVSRRLSKKTAVQGTSRASKFRRLFPRLLPFDGFRSSGAVERLVSWFKSPATGGRSYAMASPMSRWSTLSGVEALEDRVLLAVDVDITGLFATNDMGATTNFLTTPPTTTFFPLDLGGPWRVSDADINAELALGRNVIVTNAGVNDSGDDIVVQGSANINNTSGLELTFELTTNGDADGDEIDVEGDITSTSGMLNVVFNANNTVDGNVDIGFGGNVTIDTNGGDVTINASEGVFIDNASVILTHGGDVSIDADTDDMGFGPYEAQSAGTGIQTDGGNIHIISADVDLGNGTALNAGTGDITLENSENSLLFTGLGIGDGVVPAGLSYHLSELELQALDSSGVVTIGAQGETKPIVAIGGADLSSATGSNEQYDLRIFGDNDAGGNPLEFHGNDTDGQFITGDNIRMEIHHTGGDVEDESEDPDALTANLVIPGTIGELIINAVNVGTTGGASQLDISVARLDVNATGSVDIGNTGALELVDLDPIGGVGDGMLSASGGGFTVFAESPMTVNSPIVALGTIFLNAVDDAVGADDDLTINADLTSTTGDIDLNAGEDITIAAGLTLSAVAGQVSLTGDTGGSGVGGTVGTDITINSNVLFKTFLPILITGNDQTDTFTISDLELGTGAMAAMNLGASVVIDGVLDTVGGGDQATLTNVHIHNAATSGAGNPDGDGLMISRVEDFVMISDSSFNDNNGAGPSDGIEMLNVGDVTLTNVTATGNDPGLNIRRAASLSDTDGNYSFNDDGGIVLVDIAGDVTLTRTRLVDNDNDADGTGDGLNAADGADGDLLAIGGNLTLSGVVARDDPGLPGVQQNGVFVENIGGDLTIEANLGRTRALGNTGFGVFVGGGVNADIEEANFNGNGNDGLGLSQFTGNVDIGSAVAQSVNANNNGDDGIDLTVVFGNVTMTNVVAQGNASDGLEAGPIGGDFSDVGGNYNNNDDDGVDLFNVGGNASFTDTNANDNDNDNVGGGDGLDLFNIIGDVTLVNVTANNNDPGVFVTNAGSFSDTDGTYTGNVDHGIHLVDIVGDVTLTRTQADDNDADNDGTGDGVFMEDGDADDVAIGGNLLVQGGLFRNTDGFFNTTNNQEHGIKAEGIGGDATFEDSTGVVESVLVSGNNEDGIDLEDVLGDVSLTNVTSINNFEDGFDVDDTDATPGGANSVDILDSVFDGAGIDGANTGSGSADGADIDDIVGVIPTTTISVRIRGGSADGTNDDGVDSNNTGDIVIEDFSASSNEEEGIEIDNAGDVTMTNVSANGNDADLSGDGEGINIQNVGDILFTNVTANQNDPGVDVDGANSFTDIDGTYNQNDDGGVVLANITGTNANGFSIEMWGTVMNDNDADGDDDGNGLTATVSISGDVALYGVTASDTGNAGDQWIGLDIGYGSNIGGDLLITEDTRPITPVPSNVHDNESVGIFAGALGQSTVEHTSVTGSPIGIKLVNQRTLLQDSHVDDNGTSILIDGGEAVLQRNDINNGGDIGVHILDDATDLFPLVDLGQDPDFTPNVAITSVVDDPNATIPVPVVSVGLNTFSSFADPATAANGAIVVADPDFLPGSSQGERGVPDDIPAFNNTFNSPLNPELVIYHDFDDPALRLIDFADLSDLFLKFITPDTVVHPLPQLIASPFTMINEGDDLILMGSFTAAHNQHVVTIDWGDGHFDFVNLVNFDNDFMIAHEYQDDDPSLTPQDEYVVQVTVTENKAGPDSIQNNQPSGTFRDDTIQVKNVPPFFTSPLTISSTSGNVGDQVTVSGFFGDPGIVDTFFFEIDPDNDGVFEIKVDPVTNGIIPATQFTVLEATNAFVFQICDDDDGCSQVTIPVNFGNVATNPGVFYNNTPFDGNSAALNVTDELAIDPTKVPATLNAPTTFNNVIGKDFTGFIFDLPATAGVPVLADVTTRVGTVGDTNTWAAGPSPSQILVRPGAGATGGPRVHVSWPSNGVGSVPTASYLAIDIAANANTGLGGTNTFIYGVNEGDTGTNLGVDFNVNAFDWNTVAVNIPMFGVGVGNPLDLNSDTNINAFDFLKTSQNFANFLPQITPTNGGPAIAGSSAVGGLAIDEALSDSDDELAAALPQASFATVTSDDGRVGDRGGRDQALAMFAAKEGRAGEDADDLFSLLAEDIRR